MFITKKLKKKLSVISIILLYQEHLENTMFFKNEPVSNNAYFAVPHLPKPITAKRLGNMRSPLEDALLEVVFNGKTRDNDLSLYYERAKKKKKNDDEVDLDCGADFVFIDADAEEEFAELLDVELYDEEKEKAKKKDHRPKLTDTQIAQHHEKIADIRHGLEAMKVMETWDPLKVKEALETLSSDEETSDDSSDDDD